MSTEHTINALTIDAPVSPAYGEILTPEALTFLAALQTRFGATRTACRARRAFTHGRAAGDSR